MIFVRKLSLGNCKFFMNKKQNSTTMPISIHSENLKAWNTQFSIRIIGIKFCFRNGKDMKLRFLKENFNLVNFRTMAINIKMTKLCSFMNFNLFSYTLWLSLIHISEPTRQEAISYAVFCLKKTKL